MPKLGQLVEGVQAAETMASVARGAVVMVLVVLLALALVAMPRSELLMGRAQTLMVMLAASLELLS